MWKVRRLSLINDVIPMKVKSQIVYPQLGIVDEIEEEVLEN